MLVSPTRSNMDIVKCLETLKKGDATFQMDIAKCFENVPKVAEAVQLSPEIVELSVLATVGLIVMWAVFWLAIVRAKENVHDVLMSTGFFRTVTVMGVIAATVVLSLASRLDGNVTGAILSGIVGYVLGQISSGHGHTDDKKKSDTG